jgi:hypothetical protein
MLRLSGDENNKLWKIEDRKKIGQGLKPGVYNLTGLCPKCLEEEEAKTELST